MPRIRPLSPDGQVMISDIGAHLLEMGLPGRQSAERQGWGQLRQRDAYVVGNAPRELRDRLREACEKLSERPRWVS